MLRNVEWKPIRILQSGMPIERFWNAGLSPDGNLCFVTDIDEYLYIVFDVTKDQIIWKSSDDTTYPSLEEWVKDGYIEIDNGVAVGKYRLFGLGYNHPISQDENSGISLTLNIETKELILSELASRNELQRLKFEAFSGDWAFATFSDSRQVIAVIEPYDITFFGRHSGEVK